MKVLVCGSRRWTDEARLRGRLDRLPDATVLIHGAASGADQMAARYGGERDWEIRPFYADWEGDGKRAGILRNLAMLDEQPERVIAFQINGSRGTQHTITEARRRGIPVEVYSA